MTKRLYLASALAIAMLVACSKPAPVPLQTEDDEADQPAAMAAPAPQVPKRSMGPADYPAKLLPMIDTAPRCQPFRDQLEEAGKIHSNDPLPVDINEVNQIVVRAHEAGCTRKP